MSKILTQKEKAEKRNKAEITYKIIASSVERVASSVHLLRRFYGSENVNISPIMKNLGESGFHCFVNVLPSKGEQ